MNNLAPMKNCPGGVQGNLNWIPGYERKHTLQAYQSNRDIKKSYTRFCLFDLILYVSSTIFQLGTGLPGLHQY